MNAIDSFRIAAYNVALKQMFRIPPERIHGLMSRGLECVSSSEAAQAVLRKLCLLYTSDAADDVAGV